MCKLSNLTRQVDLQTIQSNGLFPTSHGASHERTIKWEITWKLGLKRPNHGFKGYYYGYLGGPGRLTGNEEFSAFLLPDVRAVGVR